MTWWPAVVFGWPSILLALVLACIGLAQRNRSLMIASAVVSLPFSAYLSGTPGIGLFGLAIPALLLGLAAAVRYGRPVKSD